MGDFGRLDTKLTAAAESENGKLICYIKESDIEKINGNMTAQINGNSYAITDISAKPIAVEEGFTDFSPSLLNGRE